ncbi:DUF2690 domain-containing protein [Streptomyces sp. NPDC046939]|uniref:DUF2690 domain-containing protein n=1 Tax=Streptomyces sp. NPDC046939 TaxID=3155376 RepID=UPI00340DAB9A
MPAEPIASAGAPGGSASPGGQFGPPVDGVVPVASSSGGSGNRGRRGHVVRRVLVSLAGAIGTALLVLVAYVLTSFLTGQRDEKAEPPPTPTTSAPRIPAGVKCVADGCTGKDPEDMKCGGERAESPVRTVVGTVTVEVRYSETCKAAWARIQGAAPGDSVRLEAGAKKSGKGLVDDADTDAYTPMVAVDSPADAKACATLASGRRGCTR